MFRQEGSSQNSAGQFEEHEMARCVAPLLFCYTEKDKPYQWVLHSIGFMSNVLSKLPVSFKLNLTYCVCVCVLAVVQ